MVWRRLKIPGNTSLAQLHQTIQIAFGWDDDHLHQFHIYGKDYGIYHDGGLMFDDDPYQVYLDDFEFDPLDKFTYEYNFFEHWLVDVRIENIEELSVSDFSINCIKGNGMLGVNKHDEIKATLDLFEAIAKAIVETDKKITVDDLRPFADAVNAVRFNRHSINQHLRTNPMNS